MVESEFQVFDSYALTPELLFVEGLDCGSSMFIIFFINIFRSIDQFMAMLFDHPERIFEQTFIICFQMNDPVDSQDLAVPFEERRGSEALVGAPAWFERVRKGQPYLVHFAPGEEMCQELNPASDESGIADLQFIHHLASFPEPGPFYIDPYIISLRMGLRQVHRVFAFSAAQLQDDGMLVLKEIFVPVSFYGEPFHQLLVGQLYEVTESEVFGKMYELFLCHLEML
jgi:hypothetical protein